MTDPSRSTLGQPRSTTRHEIASATLLVTILVIAVGALGLAIRVGGPPAVDLSLPSAVMAWYPPAATALFDATGGLPIFAAVMLAGAATAAVARRPDIAVSFVLGLCGEIPSALVKLIVDRPRPPASTEIEAFVTAASYPSGHTVRAVLMAGLVVSAIGWRHRSTLVRSVAVVVGLAFVAAVGLARIASGEHWPTDVLGGLLLGAAWLTVCVTVATWLDDRRRDRLTAEP